MHRRDGADPINPCDACGACCREAFDSVPVGEADEHIATRHPDLIRVHDDGWRDLQRIPTATGSRCVCLRGSGAADAPFRCTIYAERPTNCRDLEVGSENCALARERVGLPPLTSTGHAPRH